MKRDKKILAAVAVLAVTSTAAFTGALVGCNAAPYDEYGSTYYVSVDGKPMASGAKNDPYEISALLTNNGILKPGDTVLVQPGTYKLDAKIIMQVSGTYKHNITVRNASTTGEKVTLDFSDMQFLSTNRGVELYSDYVYWYGIDICGAGDNGMYIGGSYNTVEYCEFYNNRDTGLQIGRKESGHSSIEQWPSYNLVKNCTSHNNYDNETYGENADGFAAKLTVGYGNVFDGCIAYRNSDDGWDLYAKSDSGNIGQVIMYNCVAFENGYLEYTQAECNALFPKFVPSMAESETNSYVTRDGDGNGFKLGGSVMEGDVLLYNCLSFNNRMHGVTDNSNPGYIKIDGVTSYNNSAAICNDSSDPNFGKVLDIKNHDSHNNIDLARNSYSYNTVRNTISVTDGYAKSLGNDEYRGSVTDSLLIASASNANKISGSLDADTKNAGGAAYTDRVSALAPADVFKALPFVKNGSEYVYNITGLEDMGADYEGGAATRADRVHHKYRNGDGSLNMGSILAVKDYTKLLGNDKKIGSELDKGSWEDYTHFDNGNAAGEAKSRIAHVLSRAKDVLTVNTDENACYQNFEVMTKQMGCTISWSSSNENLIKVGQKYEDSFSQSQYITMDVTRPTDSDASVKLTATISYLNRSVVKEFNINVKKDVPKVGGIKAVVAASGEEIENGGTVIFNLYQQHTEPEIRVENGAYYSGKLLTSEQYDLTTKYEHAENDTSKYNTVAGFTPNTAGVYRITHTVSLKGESEAKTMSYKIYIASSTADVDFSNATVSINRHGYAISGSPNSATGHVYALSSPTKLTFANPADIKTAEGVVDNEFRATSVSYQYENPNNAAYYIYYALGNVKGDVTSQIYEVPVAVQNVATPADFMKVAQGAKIASENPALTIYMLTECLDFTGVTWASKNSFSAVLNGNGHTVSNVTVVAKKDTEASLFNQFVNGTLMNINFENITLDGSNQSDPSKPFKQVGIVSRCYGGYFYNISITDIDARGGQSVGALIGQIYENSPTYIDRVSVKNDDETKMLEAPGNSVGAIAGLIQTNSSPVSETLRVYISNCYSGLEIGHFRYSGGIVGRYDAQKATVDYYLEIKNCLSAGDIYASYNSAGGILGAEQGNGRMSITKCLFVGKLYHAYQANDPVALETSQKNSSGMIGGFVATADVTISDCISVLQEYNVNYQPGVSYYPDEEIFATKNMLGNLFDEEVWEFHFKDGDTNKLVAPYATVKAGACDCGTHGEGGEA